MSFENASYLSKEKKSRTMILLLKCILNDLFILISFVFLFALYFHINDENCCMSDFSVSYNHSGTELQMEFEPHKVYMSPGSGRVYHPASSQYGNIGLIRSKMAIEFSKYFEFELGEHAPPTHFTWNHNRYKLENDWLNNIKLAPNRNSL